MKKILVLILAALFAFALISCGDDETTGSSSVQSGNNSVGASGTDNSEDANIPDVPPDSGEQIGPGITEDSSNNDNGTGNSGTNSSNAGTNNSSHVGSVGSSGNNGSNDSGTNDNGNEDVDTGVIDVTKDSVLGILGDAMDPFNAADTFGNEGQISSFTKYDGNYDLSQLSAGKRIEITAGGIYRVTGKSLNGQVYIKAKGQNVIVLLDGVDLTSTTSTPPIYAEDCASLKIILAEGSVNRLEDTAVNGENGVIKVKSCNLTLGGKGRLTIKANGKNGISNTKELIIEGGTYVITSTRHAIYGKLGVTINGGKFTLNSARSGIKSGDDEVGKETEGKIVINSGSIHIRCNTDGLNSYGPVEINNGRITIEAKSRGIDATKDVTINGGTLIFSTENDTIRTSKATYDEKGKVLTSGATISILGNSNVKIASYGNGIQAENVKVSTSGVLYIYTTLYYAVSETGAYKRVNDAYVLIEEGERYTGTRYNPLECKGVEAANKIEIVETMIGINSFEDCLNATEIVINNLKGAFATERDAMEASTERLVQANIKIEGVKTDVTIIKSDKGLKANNTVTLSEGYTKIVASTDAIKADTVMINSGKHILFDKVEYVTDFMVRMGTVVCISTTNAPVSVRAAIPSASGVITNKNLCTSGELVQLVMGTQSESIVLPKDYTEKISVLYIAPDESSGTCTFTVNQKVDVLGN